MRRHGILVPLACALALISTVAFAMSPPIVTKTGIDVLRERGFDILRGKRVGLITNPTGLTSDLQSTIDILFRAEGVQLTALYGPEHGVRGDAEAGKYIDTYVDKATGLPVYSLYGKTRKPTKEMLSGIDVLVYDIQDIGVRSYTYISTMGLAMEAAAENGLEFVVLDRPDPLTGNQVGGPMLEPQFKSFVGAFPVPYVYGMTAGELAEMINGEGWLNGGRTCKLTVVPLQGWNRSMWWDETGLEWVPTSPHIPHASTTIFYVLTGLLGELGTANQGVGYTLPFELIGAPWVRGGELAAYLNAQNLEGIRFRQMWYKPFYFDTTGIQYEGVQIHVIDRNKVDMTLVQVHILDALLKLFPDWSIFDRARPERQNTFDKVVGTTDVRRWLQSRVEPAEIVRRLDQARAGFMIKREKYLKYE
ncbi:MAG: hypothetical protein A3H45_15030 [Ignavibacteria bacterium RIFCSPLOWO2_02_FULL_55_14]|nr:MAG: hypothetical protein A3C56_08560 [Ignavibacteria bacterium RIFCSPHIGHO2_02_FULL_56_12]OGU73964.1 MAG: hypothetical protein A3H45_15030 [Ignavibacteria bacterium RIFCSPLOWO2_02_FULL_55_14]